MTTAIAICASFLVAIVVGVVLLFKMVAHSTYQNRLSRNIIEHFEPDPPERSDCLDEMIEWSKSNETGYDL